MVVVEVIDVVEMVVANGDERVVIVVAFEVCSARFTMPTAGNGKVDRDGCRKVVRWRHFWRMVREMVTRQNSVSKMDTTVMMMMMMTTTTTTMMMMMMTMS